VVRELMAFVLLTAFVQFMALAVPL
jgi:hypothetical protein